MVRPDAEVAEVVDAELVPKPKPPRSAPVTIVGTVVRRPVHVVATAATHRHTKTAGKALGRNLVYVFGGLQVLARRLWEAKTNSRYERIMRGAEAIGDWERLEEWEKRSEGAKERRHKRRMDAWEAPAKLIRAATMALFGFTAALLALGGVLAVGYHDPSWIATPIMRFVDLVVWVSWAITIAWGPFVLALPWLAVLTLWHIGRTMGKTPRFLMSGRRTEVEITPSIVVLAYRDCGIAELRKRIEAMDPDARAAMVGLISAAGGGQQFDFTPPRGGAALARILAQRDRIAEGLGRHPYELHMSIVERGVIRNWAAYPGALDEPIGTSPLVYGTDLRADYRRGHAPWGQNLRGDAVEISLFQRHVLIAGQSNQGKTRCMLALALWLALDKDVEFRIADLKGMNDKTGLPDWEPLRDIASVFIAGPTDSHVVAATEMIEDAVIEMNRRLATPGGKWKPLVVIVDEAQKAFMCPLKDNQGRQYGGQTNNSRFFMACREMGNQGRVADALLWLGAQDPTNQNFPAMVRDLAHICGCLAIGTPSKAKMVLGEPAIDGGAAPHLLRPGLDKGTLVVAGDLAAFSERDPSQSSVTVRTYFIDHDPAMEIAERAKELRGPVKRPEPDEATPDVDFLADVAEVMDGEPEVGTTTLLKLLHQLNPTEYPSTFDARALTAALADEGVTARKLGGKRGGRMYVLAEDVHAAFRRRDDTEL